MSVYLLQVYIFFLHLKKKATEARQLLIEAYSEYDADLRMCQRWFERFKYGDFDIEEKKRPDQVKKFENVELKPFLDQDPLEMQGKLEKHLE